MNSRIFYLFVCANFIISCKENPKGPTEKVTAPKVETTNKEPLQHEGSGLDYEANLKEYFQDFKIYELQDTIVTDLNGDQVPEKIYFNSKKNIIVKDGKSGKENIMKNASDDDFGWVEYWATTNDKNTFEITIVNGELGDQIETTLDHPSIIVRKEGIGGIISFKNGEYKWIHQAD
jgi:ribosomal protein S4E